MRVFTVILFAVMSLCAHAGEQRVYQRDSQGNIEYHKPSYVVQDNGRIIQADSLGHKQYHLQQYQTKDGKIYQTDSMGNIQYYKPSYVIKR